MNSVGSYLSVLFFLLVSLIAVIKFKSKEAKIASLLVSISILVPVYKIVTEPYIKISFGFPINFFEELYVTSQSGAYTFSPLVAYHDSRLLFSVDVITFNIINYFLSVAIVYFILRFIKNCLFQKKNCESIR